MKILIVGGGNMGLTYAECFTTKHNVKPADLYILEHQDEKAQALRDKGYINATSQASSFVAEADVIILAVKPQDAAAMYAQVKPWLKPAQVVLSIMAGVKIAGIANALGSNRIVRAMPNLPAQIGMGITGFTGSSQVTREELFTVQNLLNTTGKSIYFENEAMLDAVTAISGSGPAYVFYFMQAMIDKAVEMGFTQNQAELLVQQTFIGATHLLQADNLSCAEWIKRVASKGGTTEAAINTFGGHTINTHIGEGLQAALNRAVELGA